MERNVRDGHTSAPLLAESAVREGSATAENAARAIDGQPQLPLHFHSLGTLVSLGRSQDIAQFARLGAQPEGAGVKRDGRQS